MKKLKCLLSIFMLTVLLIGASKVFAIAGPSDMDTRAVEPTGRFMSINITGIVKNENDKMLHIPFSDLELRMATISKEEIKERIEQSISTSHAEDHYIVKNIDNLTMVDENGRLYSLKENIIYLGKYFKGSTPQKFRLNGNVELERVNTAITTPATEVKVSYTAGFFIVNEHNEVEKYLDGMMLHDGLHKTLKVGESVSSKEMLDLAQTLLNQSYLSKNNISDPYVIVKRNTTSVVSDASILTQRKYRSLYDEYDENLSFTYTVGERQLQQEPDKRINGMRNLNTDQISEKYTLIKRSQLQAWLNNQRQLNLKSKKSVKVNYYHGDTLIHSEMLKKSELKSHIMVKDGTSYLAVLSEYIGEQLRVKVIPEAEYNSFTSEYGSNGKKYSEYSYLHFIN